MWCFARDQVTNAGDDSISVLALNSDAKAVTNMVIEDNLALDNAPGRGIVEMGGQGHTIEDNVAAGGTVSGNTEGDDAASNTRAAQDVTMRNNTIADKPDSIYTPIGPTTRRGHRNPAFPSPATRCWQQSRRPGDQQQGQFRLAGDRRHPDRRISV
jgi:hypothetical protein